MVCIGGMKLKWTRRLRYWKHWQPIRLLYKSRRPSPFTKKQSLVQEVRPTVPLSRPEIQGLLFRVFPTILSWGANGIMITPVRPVEHRDLTSACSRHGDWKPVPAMSLSLLRMAVFRWITRILLPTCGSTPMKFQEIILTTTTTATLMISMVTASVIIQEP